MSFSPGNRRLISGIVLPISSSVRRRSISLAVLPAAGFPVLLKSVVDLQPSYPRHRVLSRFDSFQRLAITFGWRDFAQIVQTDDYTDSSVDTAVSEVWKQTEMSV